MTALTSIGLIALFFVIPYLVGNAYAAIFRKKTMGIARMYLSGMAIVYVGLFALQLLSVKLKFNFYEATQVYHIYFIALCVVGIVMFGIHSIKNKHMKCDIEWSKKAWWLYALIVLQGILCIVCKNPYFENNGLLETTQITMQTGTIYEYNAFSGEVADAGFPLSNKLMFLPVFYAYISTVFKINPIILFNFIVPAVTFISFYLVMILWVQKLEKEYGMKWQLLLTVLLWLVQIGDGWSNSTAFRVLHTGYMGEAVFFGVLFAYGLYEIKNKCYLTSLICLATFPGLIKYDTPFDFVKGFGGYWKEAAYYSKMTVLYIVSVIHYIAKNKKPSTHLLSLNLTICNEVAEIYAKLIKKETVKWHKVASGLVVAVLLLLCGNVSVISGATQWRSNVYGATKNEYEILVELSELAQDEPIRVLAYDEVNKWIRRLNFEIEPVVGYDMAGAGTWWYSYDEYDELHTEMWESIHKVTNDLEIELMAYKEEILMDYVVIERITEIPPIRENENLQCVLQTPSYFVYSVDKK